MVTVKYYANKTTYKGWDNFNRKNGLIYLNWLRSGNSMTIGDEVLNCTDDLINYVAKDLDVVIS